MAKVRTMHVCRECGHEAFKWAGQCAGCSEWNTLDEVTVAPSSPAAKAGRGRAGPGGRAARPVPLRDVQRPRD